MNDKSFVGGLAFCRIFLGKAYLEVYAKASLKKYRPMAARNEDKKVFSGLL
jgi:hypothetical protein